MPKPTLLEQQLRAHPLVRGLPAGDAAKLLAHAEAVEFERGTVIFSMGEPAETFFLVRTGVVALNVQTEGGASRKIEAIAEGTVLGWSWLFPPFEWQFDAVAETLVRGIAIDAGALRQEFETDPAFAYRLVSRIAEVMAKRLYATRRQVLNLVE